MKFYDITYSVPWNLFLITIGCLITAVGLNAFVIPYGMITGGFSGAGILLYYYTDILSPGIWFLVLNIPVFLAGWIFVSRRFLLYSLFGTVALTLGIDFVTVTIPVNDIILAVLAGGALVGTGAGIIFRSLGSAGGNDIISIILNQKLGIRIGTYNFCFNFVLFLFSFGTLETDLILYSMAMSYIISQVIEYVLSLFNQRKIVFIISDHPREITDAIMKKLKRGATFLKGEGAYTGSRKDIIFTVANTFQIKRIEEIAFGIDPDVFMITENTFNVMGKGFSRRKIY